MVQHKKIESLLQRYEKYLHAIKISDFFSEHPTKQYKRT